MTEKPHTDADVELAARAEYEHDMREAACPDTWDETFPFVRDGYRRRARAGLDALAAAGRLLPANPEVTIECDIDWVDVRGDGRYAQAKSYAWKPEECDHLLAKEIQSAELFHRAPVRIRRRSVMAFADGSKLVGPWLPVEVPL